MTKIGNPPSPNLTVLTPEVTVEPKLQTEVTKPQTPQKEIEAFQRDLQQQKGDATRKSDLAEVPKHTPEEIATQLAELKGLNLGTGIGVKPAEALQLTLVTLLPGEGFLPPMDARDAAALLGLSPKDLADVPDKATRDALAALMDVAKAFIPNSEVKGKVSPEVEAAAKELMAELKKLLPLPGDMFRAIKSLTALLEGKLHAPLSPQVLKALEAVFGKLPESVLRALRKMGTGGVQAAADVTTATKTDEAKTDGATADDVDTIDGDDGIATLLQPITLPRYDETITLLPDRSGLDRIFDNMMKNFGSADVETMIMLVMQQIQNGDREDLKATLAEMDANRMKKDAQRKLIQQLRDAQAKAPSAEDLEDSEVSEADAIPPLPPPVATVPEGISNATFAARLGITEDDLQKLMRAFESVPPETLLAMTGLPNIQFSTWLLRPQDMGGAGLETGEGVPDQHALVATFLVGFPEKVAAKQQQVEAAAAKRAARQAEIDGVAEKFGLTAEQASFLYGKYHGKDGTFEEFAQAFGLSSTNPTGNSNKVQVQIDKVDGQRELNEVGKTYNLDGPAIKALWKSYCAKNGADPKQFGDVKSGFPTYLSELGLKEGGDNKAIVDAYFKELAGSSPLAMSPEAQKVAAQVMEVGLKGEVLQSSTSDEYKDEAKAASDAIKAFGKKPPLSKGKRDSLDKLIKDYMQELVWKMFYTEQKPEGRQSRYHPEDKLAAIMNKIKSGGWPEDAQRCACDYVELRMSELMRDMTAAGTKEGRSLWGEAMAGAGVGAAIGTPLGLFSFGISTVIGAAIGAGVAAIIGAASDPGGFYSSYLKGTAFGDHGFKLEDTKREQEADDGKGGLWWAEDMHTETRSAVSERIVNDFLGENEAGTTNNLRDAVFGSQSSAGDQAAIAVQYEKEYAPKPMTKKEALAEAKDAAKQAKLEAAKDEAKKKAREKMEAAAAKANAKRDYLLAPDPTSPEHVDDANDVDAEPEKVAPAEKPPPPPEDLTKLTSEELQSRIDKARDDLESMSELGEMQQMRMQMQMDRYTKSAQLLSTLMKKLSDTSDGIIRNMQ